MAKLPLTWNDKESLAWQTPLAGYGQSSPVVWGDQVYVTMVQGKQKEKQLVVAFSWGKGTQLWSHEQPTVNTGENSDYFSRAAPTPVVDQSGVIAWFEGGDVVALDHQGSVRWKKDLVQEYGPIQARHGLSSSLAQSTDSVFVWVQRDNGPYLLALSKEDGSVKWRVDRPAGTAWSSPVMIPMENGGMHLVLSTSGPSGGGGAPGGPRGAGGPGPSAGAGGPASEAGTNGSEAKKPEGAESPRPPMGPPKPGQLAGLDPSSGETLWELSGLFGNSSSTPVVAAPGQVLVGASAGREGGPSKEAISTNGLVAIKQDSSGKWKAEYLWHATKATCGFCSPAMHNGMAYFVDRRGMVHCLDANTGEEAYMERLGHPVWATPIGAGDRVYFVGEEGVTTVVKAGAKFETLASNALWQASDSAIDEKDPRSMLGRTRQYAVVPMPNGLLIRRGDVLYAIK